MKVMFALLFGLTSMLAWSQKAAGPRISPALAAASLSTSAQYERMISALDNTQILDPIGTQQFYMAEFKPIYFEAYPNPSHNYLGIDFPSNTNVQFIRILDVSGMVVATYNRWSRLLYIGHLQSGLYQVQVVQRNFMAHATSFYKR